MHAKIMLFLAWTMGVWWILCGIFSWACAVRIPLNRPTYFLVGLIGIGGGICMIIFRRRFAGLHTKGSQATIVTADRK